MAVRLLLICVAVLIACPVHGDTFHVRVDGADDESRDGRSPKDAWASLAFACSRVPGGEHTIQLGPGDFMAEETAFPPSGVTIIGQGYSVEQPTRIMASASWPLPPETSDGEDPKEYLIALNKAENVTIRGLALESPADHRITGAIQCLRSTEVELAGVAFRNFAWNGLRIENSSGFDIHHCRFENASTEKLQFHGGAIRTRWLKDSRIHHNTILSDTGNGYGYKAAGHDNVQIDHNYIDVAGEFAIESAHENEYGVEIDHNVLTRCISIPKGGQSGDPSERGFSYTFWIHDNLLTDSYTIEGPRNHLIVSHNYIRIERPNGRVYTQHGGVNNGPVAIHHNVIENVDRSFVYMNEGLAESIHVYNNTVYFADAGDRTGPVFSAYTEERLNNWVVKNNIFVAPEEKPRRFMPTERGVPTKITATDNVYVNVTNVPEGNHSVKEAMIGLALDGEKPWPYFAPQATSMVVDQGVKVGLPFSGTAPDIGAYELDKEEMLTGLPTPDIAESEPERSKPRSRKLHVLKLSDASDAPSEPIPAATDIADRDGPIAMPPGNDGDQANTLSKKPRSASPFADPAENELVEVDWLEEAFEGGVTMIALAALSVFLLAAVAERTIMLRRGRFTPRTLGATVLPLFAQGQFDAILAQCRKSRSTLGHVIEYLVVHRKADPQTLAAGAGDLGGRAIAEEEHKLTALAVVAGVAPLLGLLGTMIGMIESFKLVEVFGDDGGASLLAGSISKALITTATGLILAIPALLAHFVFKHRTHRIGIELEEQTERVFNAWFLDPDKDRGASTPLAGHMTSDAPVGATQPPVSLTSDPG